MAKFFTIQFQAQAIKEFGAAQAPILARKAAQSAHRLLSREGIASNETFQHIAEHFRPDPAKPHHGVFMPAYRTRPAVAKLMAETAASPGSEPMLSKSDDGDWAVVVQRFYGANSPVGEGGLQFLILIVDLDGSPITAYPAARYAPTGARV